MERKDQIDAFGAVSLIGFAAVLGFNQVVIKVTNGGIQPVFSACLRSVGAMILLYLWMRLRNRPPRIVPGAVPACLLAGTLFAFEFVVLYLAVDLTSVARVSIIFYSMPVWLALMAHVAIPGEQITKRKGMGLALCVAGVIAAISDRPDTGEASLAGDLMVLVAASCWAGIALISKTTKFSQVDFTMQLFWQVSISAPLLFIAALFFGPLIRDLQPIHLWGIGFQTVIVVTAGYLFWFWLLKIYPASGVASFSFLSPIFGVAFGWLILGETVGPALTAALVLVVAGLLLINRPKRAMPPAPS